MLFNMLRYFLRAQNQGKTIYIYIYRNCKNKIRLLRPRSQMSLPMEMQCSQKTVTIFTLMFILVWKTQLHRQPPSCELKTILLLQNPNKYEKPHAQRDLIIGTTMVSKQDYTTAPPSQDHATAWQQPCHRNSVISLRLLQYYSKFRMILQLNCNFILFYFLQLQLGNACFY